MYHLRMRSREDLVAFVARLSVPEERRAVVLLELENHVFEQMAELEASGVDPAAAEAHAVRSLGDPDALARSLTVAERAFTVTPARAIWLGLRSGALVAGAALAGCAIAPGNPIDAPGLALHGLPLLVLFAAIPWREARTMLASHARGVERHRAGDLAGFRRHTAALGNFWFSMSFLLWVPWALLVAGTKGALSLGAAESLIARSSVTLIAVPLATALLLSIPRRSRVR